MTTLTIDERESCLRIGILADKISDLVEHATRMNAFEIIKAITMVLVDVGDTESILSDSEHLQLIQRIITLLATATSSELRQEGDANDSLHP